jgi:hypothetical protein
MSYYIRWNNLTKTAMLIEDRPHGYHGSVLNLPMQMALGYEAFERSHEQGEEAVMIHVFPDHLANGYEPVLRLRVWFGREPAGLPRSGKTYVLTAEGSVQEVLNDSVVGHSDPFSWAESLGLGHGALHDGYVKAHAEDWPEAHTEALRRNLIGTPA